MKSNVKNMKWISGGFEALLGIPVLGGWIVFGFGYTPLFIALILHIITLVLAKKAGVSAIGNIFGIITSCLAWIPILGMILHILSAIFILIGAATQRSK
ncbi:MULTISPECIES: hypothetical protein [Bacillaceae]|uniref:Uncharacterized protein n=1 Tax=Gottfriedia luciferensis TaxID=178774 RepID=A0ABX3A3Q8_9BACI|nr:MULTISPECIES: hypothetical protein [Bacillaceae]ODG93933.1 hypothetical protein BED47_01815 [Gottfriedia luciferensis]SFC32602.1 hypothetical protein SAMN02799633_00455 [Bacillus sp. UNCCL81]